MSTFLLTWNPDKWVMDWEAELRRARKGAREEQWSTGNRTTGIEKDDYAFLVMQGRRRGIVAEGTLLGWAEGGRHWDGSGRDANYAAVRRDVLLPLNARARTEDLLLEVPGVPWRHLYRSGVRVADDVEESLHAAWSAHVDSLPEGVVVRAR